MGPTALTVETPVDEQATFIRRLATPSAVFKIEGEARRVLVNVL
jgi:hypothetical protein